MTECLQKNVPAWESRECTACANSNCVHVVPGDDDYDHADYNNGDGVVDDGDADLIFVADITDYICGENSVNLWRFIKIYAVFVLDLCGEKSVWRKSDKYEVCGDGDGHDDSVNSGQPISPVRAPVAELTLSLR